MLAARAPALLPPQLLLLLCARLLRSHCTSLRMLPFTLLPLLPLMAIPPVQLLPPPLLLLLLLLLLHAPCACVAGGCSIVSPLAARVRAAFTRRRKARSAATTLSCSRVLRGAGAPGCCCCGAARGWCRLQGCRACRARPVSLPPPAERQC
jgi:hypothetical protein